MRRIVVAPATDISLSTPAGRSTPTAATKPVPFATIFVGAAVGANAFVLDIRGSSRGAGVQVVKQNQSLTAGMATTTGYYENGILVSEDTFTLSKPDAEGIITVRGTGKFVHGTGVYKSVEGSYNIVGTYDTNSRVSRGKLTGVINL
jgi:hypothetical protein